MKSIIISFLIISNIFAMTADRYFELYPMLKISQYASIKVTGAAVLGDNGDIAIAPVYDSDMVFIVDNKSENDFVVNVATGNKFMIKNYVYGGYVFFGYRGEAFLKLIKRFE